MRARFFLTICMFCAAQAQTGLPVPGSGNVTLSLDEYDKLAALAARQPQKQDAPPYPYVINSIRMNFEVRGESASGTIELAGEVMADGTRMVPLVSGMTILTAHQQGKDLPIEQSRGIHSAPLSGPGVFAVTLEAGLPVSIATGRASISLPVPAAGAARLTISVPGEHTLVTLLPGLITSVSSNGGSTVIEATLVSGQTANLSWAARLSEPAAPPAPEEVRFLSDVKTLISVTESELSMAALAEITVLRGKPSQFSIQAPDGFELTGVTGPTLISSAVQDHALRLEVANPEARSHQFLISLGHANGVTKTGVPLVTFAGTQRETGEVMVEGEGAIELTATGEGGLRRMDLKEASPYLRSMTRGTPETAFRYQKRAAEAPTLRLDWVRFPNSSILSAVGQRAEVTTLITSEGRSLTEVKLTLRNQSQPFLKVALPAGATILTCDVAGEKVKPVEGTDGNRVPLLRTGFRPTGPYTVSFVILHAGAPFARKGGAELTLPKLDMPVGVVEWEVFLPERYRVTDFGGDAIRARFYPRGEEAVESAPPLIGAEVHVDALGPGQLGGVVTDPSGAVVPGTRITVLHLSDQTKQETVTDREGRWLLPGVPSGRLRIIAFAPGFQTAVRELDHDASRGARLSLSLQVGIATEAVTVTASSSELPLTNRQQARVAPTNAAEVSVSANVKDLQRRVTGVLPIAMTVPRAGNAYRFVRPLVVDEETRLTFHYRSK
jgi:carboxypeptidase family protein